MTRRPAGGRGGIESGTRRATGTYCSDVSLVCEVGAGVTVDGGVGGGADEETVESRGAEAWVDEEVAVGIRAGDGSGTMVRRETGVNELREETG